MTITEQARFNMHAKFREVLGVEVANTTMEHLPPVGWADMARQSSLNHVIAGMWIMGSTMVLGFIGLATMVLMTR